MFPTFVPHWVTHTSHNCQKISTINHGNQRSSMTSLKNLFRSSISYIPSPKNIPQTHTPPHKKTHPAFFGESSQNNTYIRFKSEKKTPEKAGMPQPVDSNPRERPKAKMLGQGPENCQSLASNEGWGVFFSFCTPPNLPKIVGP